MPVLVFFQGLAWTEQVRHSR